MVSLRTYQIWQPSKVQSYDLRPGAAAGQDLKCAAWGGRTGVATSSPRIWVPLCARENAGQIDCLEDWAPRLQAFSG